MSKKIHLSWHSSLVLAFLLVAGFFGNLLHLHLFIGTGFIFGSVAALLVLRLFGLPWGFLAGVAGAIYPFLEASHPYSALLLAVEPVLVGLALRGKCQNIALLDGAFWFFLGMPLLAATELWLHHGDFYASSYFALIHGFNGIFNALLATLILDFLPVRRWAGLPAEPQRVPLQQLTFNILASFLVFSAFFLILFNGKDEADRMEAAVRHRLDDFSNEIRSHISAWQQQRYQLVHKLAETAAPDGSMLSPEQLQQAADLIRLTVPDLEAVHVGNAAGVAIATSCSGDGRYGGGEPDLSDRPWFLELKRTHMPVLSEVFTGKVSHAPTVSFSAPVLAANNSGRERLAGYAAVLIRLSELKKMLALHAHESGAQVTLLDRQQRVIASSRGDLVEMRPMAPRKGYPAPPLNGNSRLLAGEGILLEEMDTRYVRETQIGQVAGWTLYLEVPARPYFIALQQRLVNNLALMWAGIIIAFLVASVVSRRLVEPLERLVEATTHIKARLLGDEDVRLDRSPVSEIDALVENFTEMTLELNRSYTELGKSNETLEQKVAERTEALSLVNLQLKQHLADREQFEVALARHSHELEQTTAELVSQKFALDQHSIVAIADPKGNITYVNDKFCEISQYSREELLGQNHRILNSGYHDKAFFRDMWGTIASGKVWQGEVRNRKKGGSFYWVETTIVPFMDTFGKPYQYVSIRTDITQRKQAEQELLRAKEAAETANRAKSEFLSRMSHELRTPLNAILGFGQLLESDRDEPLTPSQTENVEHIVKAGWHLLELVNEVLDLARIEAGMMQLHISDAPLQELVKECIDLISPLAGERQIEIKDHVSSSMPHFVRVDRVRLKQVILNYLSNAVKYNRQGGQITVECKPIPGERLRVSVADSGPGIPPDKIEQLFLPFNRLDADETEVHGAGVGLAVAKRLMEFMGGEVGVSSEPGLGATFWADVPEAACPGLGSEGAEENEADESMGGEGGDGAFKTHAVLYVEDNTVNRDLVSNIFKRHRPNYKLVCKGSAEEGLEWALSERPDLILMDVNLPGINGFEALELLREFDDLRNVPVVAVSADALPPQIEKCLKAGFYNYLTKPLNMDQFLQVVDLSLKSAQESITGI